MKGTRTHKKSAPKRRRRLRRRQTRVVLGILMAAALVTGFIAFESRPTVAQGPAVRYDYEVVNVYPHDPRAFTQGLLYRDGFLYESTGDRSSLRKVVLETGEVIEERLLDSELFAEGLADWEDTLVQLTWHAETGFIYAIEGLDLRRTFRYPGEGWGLTRLDDRLVMSDGTPDLRFLDPETLLETRRVTVTERGRPLVNLNELEAVNGQIFANIWLTDEVAIIDPASGHVTGRIDLEGLLTPLERARGADVLNGIAYDVDGDRLFVTGKLWPRLFEIRLRPR